MKQNDYMNRSQVMKTADRKLMHYISSAAYHLREAQEYLDDYKELESVSYYKGIRESWPEMARLYRQLCQADLQAARSLVSDLEDVGLISLDDWRNINETLVWFGFPAEVRSDD